MWAMITAVLWGAACTAASPGEGVETEPGSTGSSDTTGGGSTEVPPSETEDGPGSTSSGSTGEGLSSSSEGTGDASTGGATTGGPLASTVVFVNFDGGEYPGMSYTRVMGPYPAEGRDEILARMRDHFAPFDVSIIAEAPAEGPYTTAVIGVPEIPPPFEGVAPLDCGNAMLDQVGFTFYADQSPARLAAVASSGLAVMFGVGRHDDPADLAAVDPDDDAEFLDTCITPFEAQCFPRPGVCADEMQQNSYQELLLTLGPA